MYEPEKMVSDKELELVFMGTNFGTADKRKLVGECVWKVACGFMDGSTIKQICRELKLLNRKSDTLTKKGKRYLYGFTVDGVKPMGLYR